MKINFFVSGIPKGQSRPRFFKRGNFVGAYSPKTDFYILCYNEALKNKPQQPISEPIELKLTFQMPRPKSLKKGTIYHTKRPDLDNLIKAVLDALTQAGMWADDNLIYNMQANKIYSDKTGVMIEITAGS